MENLFEFDSEQNIVLTPSAMIYPQFSKLWNRDRTKTKKKAIADIGFVWYMCSQSTKRNPYYEKFANDVEGKEREIIKDICPPEWKVDKTIKDAIQLFNKNNYSESKDTMDALISTKTKIKDWFRIYDPSTDEDGLQVQRNTKTINELTKTIKEYEALIRQEEESNTQGITGGGELGAYE